MIYVLWNVYLHILKRNENFSFKKIDLW
jgi:hypothetical protein